jgi:hypothetical protein
VQHNYLFARRLKTSVLEIDKKYIWVYLSLCIRSDSYVVITGEIEISR